MPLTNIEHILLILSGKGGVGKSSVTTQLALTLCLRGYNVGVLDVDLTGPSIPRFFGVENAKITQGSAGWIPVVVNDGGELGEHLNLAQDTSSRDRETRDAQGPHMHQPRRIGSLHTMSLGFVLSSRSSAVIWRGPKKTAMVRQFLSDVAWPPLDYLLIDTPPGTSDEHISLLETLVQQTTPSYVPPPPPTLDVDATMAATAEAQQSQNQSRLPHLAGAVLVTTPQAVATSDVRKELSFCAKTRTRVVGVVENMSGFVCPHCADCSDVFGKGGGEAMANDWEVPFLGGIPLDPQFGALIEEGKLPIYPKGSKIEGVDLSESVESIDGSGSNEALSKSLAAKYLHCSLWPLFDAVASKVITSVEGSSA